MHDDTKFEEERQRLFTLIWERPASEVAKELGISDVALGKRCRRLQVPKPPRGYWTKVATGKTPRRPPLPAYREALRKRLAKQSRPERQVRLSELQRNFLDYILSDLTSVGVDTSACDLARDGIRSISPELAAEVLTLTQNRYEKWLADRATPASQNAGLSSLINLVKKLLPIAKEQLIVFHQWTDNQFHRTNQLAITLRATRDFVERIAHLSRVSKASASSYVVADLSAFEYAWSMSRIYSPATYKAVALELCVSTHDVWIQGRFNEDRYYQRYETVRIPLRDICPIDLIPVTECTLPPSIRRSTIKPYDGRLQAIMEARSIADTLSNAAFEIERTVPNERLALFDRLWSGVGEGGAGPMTQARQAWQQVENELEKWDQVLEHESAELCRDVLGVEIGDTVIVEAWKNPVRIRVEGMDVYATDERVTFSVWGVRYRKDGLPGKRVEQFHISVDNDMR